MIASIILMAGLLGIAEPEKTVHPFVDKNFGGIVVGESSLPDFEKLHGKGVSLDHGFQRCYFHPAKNQILLLSLCEDHNLCSIEVSISENSRPPETCEKAHIDFDPVTGKGIELGVPRDKVLNIYGEPGEREKLDENTIRLGYRTSYEEDPSVRIFYDVYLIFREEKLIQLYIHHGP